MKAQLDNLQDYTIKMEKKFMNGDIVKITHKGETDIGKIIKLIGNARQEFRKVLRVAGVENTFSNSVRRFSKPTNTILPSKKSYVVNGKTKLVTFGYNQNINHCLWVIFIALYGFDTFHSEKCTHITFIIRKFQSTLLIFL